MAVEYRASKSGSGSSNSVLVGVPEGSVAGDLLVVCLRSPVVGPIAPAAGWTALFNGEYTTAQTAGVFYLPNWNGVTTSWLFEFAASGTYTWHCASIKNAAKSKPINASGSSKFNSGTTTLKINSLTTVANTEEGPNEFRIFSFAAGYGGGITLSPTTAWTENNEPTAGPELQSKNELLGKTIATGELSQTASATASAFTFAFAVQPPAALKTVTLKAAQAITTAITAKIIRGAALKAAMVLTTASTAKISVAKALKVVMGIAIGRFGPATKINWIGDPLGYGGWWEQHTAGGTSLENIIVEPVTDWGELPNGTLGVGGTSIRVAAKHKLEAGSGTVGIVTPTKLLPCLPGERVTASVYVKTVDPAESPAKNRGYRVLIQFLNAAGSTIEGTELEEIDEIPDGTRLSWSAVAPAETAFTRVFYRATTTAEGDQVDYRYTRMLVEIGGTTAEAPATYFPTAAQLASGQVQAATNFYTYYRGLLITRWAEIKAALAITIAQTAKISRWTKIKAAMAITVAQTAKIKLTRKIAAAMLVTIQMAVKVILKRGARVSVGQELIPDKIAVNITPPGSNQPVRWAEDEPLPENILSGYTHSSEISGGYKDMQGTLARNPQYDWPDFTPYGDIIAYLPGEETVWEGYLDKDPGVSDDHTTMSPEGIGYQKVLEDDMAIQLGFIDSDLSKWSDISNERRQALLEANFDLNAVNWEIGFHGKGELAPGLFVEYTEYAGKTEYGAQQYYGEGVPIGEIRYDFITILPGGETPLRTNQALLSVDGFIGGAETYVSGTNHHTTSAANQKLASERRDLLYAVLQTMFTGTYEGESANDSFMFNNIKVIGTHQLEPKGTWPDIGYTEKQMLGYLINNYGAPLTCDPEELDDDGFIIPQAWYGERQSLANIVTDLNKYSLYDWFVYEGKRLQLRRPGTYGRFWKCYVEESKLNELGQDGSRLWRSIVVQYQEPNGQTRTVGPLGSGCDIETSELEITDPEHPAVKAKRTRRDILVRNIGTPEGSITTGVKWLEEANLLSRSGSCTLSGYILDDKSVLRPVSQVKAGDYVAFVNAHDTSYRKIVNASYSRDSAACECDLDAPPQGLDALLERFQVRMESGGVT